MIDETAVVFREFNHTGQLLALRLEGFDGAQLEFERWRVANGRDPEWAASERGPLCPRCQCVPCQARRAGGGVVSAEFTAP